MHMISRVASANLRNIQKLRIVSLDSIFSRLIASLLSAYTTAALKPRKQFMKVYLRLKGVDHIKYHIPWLVATITVYTRLSSVAT